MAARLRYNGKRIGSGDICRIPVLWDHCVCTQNTSLNFKMTVFKPSLSERGLHGKRNAAFRRFLQSAEGTGVRVRRFMFSRGRETEEPWRRTMKLFSLARLLVSYLFDHHLSQDCSIQVASYTASRTSLRGFQVSRGMRSHPSVYELAFLSMGSVRLHWNPILEARCMKSKLEVLHYI